MKPTLVIAIASGISLCLAIWPKEPQEKSDVLIPLAPSSHQPTPSPALERQKQVVEWVRLKEECSGIYDGQEEARIAILDTKGNVDFNALALHGISPSQFNAVQDAVSKARTRMENSFISRLEVDLSRSKPEEGVHAYRIPSDKHQGNTILQDLQLSLISACGQEDGTHLFRAIRPSYQFGCYGRQELQIQIRENKNSLDGWELKFQALEPISRTKILSKTISTTDNMEFCFGKSFQISP